MNMDEKDEQQDQDSELPEGDEEWLELMEEIRLDSGN